MPKIVNHKKLEQRLRENGPKVKVSGRDYTPAEIHDCPNLKAILVNENPNLAHQLYLQWEDAELGRLFALKYDGHPDYGAQAYHIASELGILGIKPPFSQVRADVENFEENIFRRGL